MKNEKLFDGITEIRDEIITKAEKHEFKKKKKFNKKMFIMAAAAVLVVAVGVNFLNKPLKISASTVALADEPRIMAWPDIDDYKSRDEWLAATDSFDAEYDSRMEMTAQAAEALQPFCKMGNQLFLAASGNDNKLWSPINAYIGLAMTTELTAGETKQQMLDLFGAGDIDTLRAQVSAVWESVYQNNKKEICVLANSLWLEEGLKYNQDAMDAIAYHYYASIYQGDLGSDKVNKDIAAWINNNTGNFLKDSTKNINLSQEIVMVLYSTLYFQAKWSDEFSKRNNTEDLFHAPNGDIQTTFMNKNLYQMDYYWGENFGAVRMWLKNGCCMWFILPDEGMTTDDVLTDGSYMDMVMNPKWEDKKYMKVNLSVPKFDVASSMDLKDGLKKMGVTDIFDETKSDFTNLTSDTPITVTNVNQSVRVQIDEEGVKAAAYIEIPGAGSAAPPDEIIDFILDRPFLFVISNGNLPLFSGCVNQPE